jgi:ActR/RegA family two-component response regulator
MIRKAYQPTRGCNPLSKPREVFLDAVRARGLTIDELVIQYCTLVYAETGSYQETARRLGMDRRTVKDRVDPVFLKSLRGT